MAYEMGERGATVVAFGGVDADITGGGYRVMEVIVADSQISALTATGVTNSADLLNRALPAGFRLYASNIAAVTCSAGAVILYV